MPARTGHTTFVPGKGAYTSKPSGKKTFTGSGPAPSGSKKTPERSYLEVPTVTEKGGSYTTSGYGSQKAARRAVRSARGHRRRVRRIVSEVSRDAQKRAKKAPDAFSKAQLHPYEKQVGEREGQGVAPYVPPVQGKEKVKPSDSPKAAATKRAINSAIDEGGAINDRWVKAHQGSGVLPPIRTAAQKHPAAVKKVKRQLQKLRSSGKSGKLPYLETPEQQKVAKTVLRTGQKARASRKEKLAAIETGIVESGFKNLPTGDQDSAGWRQERGMYYPEPTNVKKGAKNFFTETKTDTGGARGRGQTAGELAQTVQASAYPERYDEHAPEARQILQAFNQGKKTPVQAAALKRVEAKAQRLGINPKAPNVGKPPKKLVTRFRAAKQAMREVRGVPYQWGGGHGSPTSSPTRGGLDCSGAVGYVLNKIHALKGSATSGEMGKYLKPGPGLLTVFYNPEHTFLKLGNEYWGTSVGDSGSGGLGPHPAPSAFYLASYKVGHVPGMGKKQLLQMGFKAAGGAPSFPGMTLSSSGTSATINSGASTTMSKPGFSSKPIRVTPAQRARRTFKRLKRVGVGEAAEPKATSISLKGLERKYGVRT